MIKKKRKKKRYYTRQDINVKIYDEDVAIHISFFY